MPDDTRTGPDDAPLPPASIGPGGPPAVTSTRTSTVKETRTTASATEPVDDVVTTRHTIAVGGKSLSYKATAGRVVLREEKYEDGVYAGHQPVAEVFLTSYVADGDADTAPSTRPVAFVFSFSAICS